MKQIKFLSVVALTALTLAACNKEQNKPAEPELIPDVSVEFGTAYVWADLETSRTVSVPVYVTVKENPVWPLSVTVAAVENDFRNTSEDYTLKASELFFKSADDDVTLELTVGDDVETLNVEFLLSAFSVEGVKAGENASVRIGAGSKFDGEFTASYTYVAEDGTSSERSEDWTFATVETQMPPIPPYFGAIVTETSVTGILGVVSDGGAIFTIKTTEVETEDETYSFTINLGCGDSGQNTCYNTTIDGTQYIAAPVVITSDGTVVTTGTLRFISNGFNVLVPDYGEGAYLTYGLFSYGEKTYADMTEKGKISLGDIIVSRK